MSRSGYSDDCENLAMWRGAVASAIRGKRGQQLLRELADAMDAMPEKILIAEELTKDGAYCALGVVGAKRGLPIETIDPEDAEQVSKAFNIASPLAQEITYINDEAGPGGAVIDGKWHVTTETPAQRWIRVRQWVAEQIEYAEKMAISRPRRA